MSETRKTLAERMGLDGDNAINNASDSAWTDGGGTGESDLERWIETLCDSDCETLTTALSDAVAGWANSLGRDQYGEPIPDDGTVTAAGGVLQGDDAQLMTDALDTARDVLLIAKTSKEVRNAVGLLLFALQTVVKDHGEGVLEGELREREVTP